MTTKRRAPMSPSERRLLDATGSVPNSPRRATVAFATAIASLALILVGCGPAATQSGSMSNSMSMQLPSYAKNMKVTIQSPTDGAKVTGNTVTLTVAATGYTPSCDFAGKSDQQGSGHYHILLDKSLVNMFCTPTATISMQNVSPGTHTLTAVPTLNDHTEIEENATSIKIDYEPINPQPRITGATFAGAPTIKILSPADGATVSGAFDVVVQITNYNLSCDLMGKPDVSGYGHWHVNLDSMSGPMMGMGTMLGMSCATVFHASTTGLKAGQKHTIITLLTDNGHAPLNPPIDSAVTVTIGG